MTTTSLPMNPLLAGVRVLDLSRLLPGPFCTHYLAQMGAEVLKIEEPNGGDYCRAVSPDLFALVNAGKKSITLDLRDAKQKRQFHALVETADLLIESFRPGVMVRLGCGYDQLRRINPRLVYATLTGYGQDGPYANRPGHDLNFRASAGELDLQAQAGRRPLARPFPAADLAGGLNAAIGMLAALVGARASGIGSLVDVSIHDSVLAMQVMEIARLRERDLRKSTSGDALFAPMPQYDCFECADGRFIALGAMERKFFSNFCELVGRPDLLDRALWDSVDGEPLRSELVKLFKLRSRDAWDQLLAHHDTCVSSVLSMDEALQDPQVKARGVIGHKDGKPVVGIPIRFDNRTIQTLEVPALGADNAIVAQNN